MAVRSDEESEPDQSASLQVHLLGAPKISIHGAPLEGLTSTKARALLFYLLVTGRAHMRPALAGLLWGGVPEASARASLRKAIQQLRREVGAYLDIERDRIGVGEDADVWVDAVEFDTILRRRRIAQAPARVRHAIDLYQGAFLEGFYVHDAPAFEAWALSERSRLQALLLNHLHDLAVYYADRDDLKTAIAFIRRSLEVEPWREEAHRHLMTWLARTGQRGAALAQYERCSQALHQELGVEPSEETMALVQRIRSGDLAPTTSARARPLGIRPARPAFLEEVAPAAERPAELFVGRQRQVQRLEELLEAALSGRVSAAFIRGEAGWGKTSLLHAFARRAQERHRHLIVASGTCGAYAATDNPYLAFQAILRMLCADIEERWAAGSITRSQALRLWDLLPHTVAGLASHAPDLIGTCVRAERLLHRAAAHEGVGRGLLARLLELSSCRPGARVDQQSLFDEWAALLSSLSAHRPLLLMVDDLHWADTSSVGLLFHLARRLRGRPVLILSAYRPEEVLLGGGGAEHPLLRVLGELRGLLGDVWVELGPGSPGESRQFVDAVLDSEPNRLREGFRRRLTHETEGHPLCTVELVREMKAEGHLYRDADGRWLESPTLRWDALPKRVEGVIEARMVRLDPELRGIVDAASVEGESFTAEVVARVQNLDEGRVIKALSGDLAGRHYLVCPEARPTVGGRRISRYRFSHHLFQTYLYQALDPVARSYLHGAVGRAVEAVYQGQIDDVAVRLARHFQEAGALEKAVTYLEQAGDAAARVHAHAEAAMHYQRAIELAGQVEMQDEDLARLRARLEETVGQG